MAQREEDVIVNETVAFCRALRESGLSVTPSEAIDAATALNIVDRADRREVFLGLRTILTSRVEDFPVFERLFDHFWSRLSSKQSYGVAETLQRHQGVRGVRFSPREQGRKDLGYFLKHWGAATSQAEEQVRHPVASEIESNAPKDFSAHGTEDAAEISRLARRIAKRLARARSRRWKPVRRGPRIDLRRSLRQSMRVGGELIELSHRRRKEKKTRLVVICDVSGSMDLYSRLLLQFVYGLQNSFARVESFVFSTGIEKITSRLKSNNYREVLERLSSDVRGWSGGTRIGPSIAEFNRRWHSLINKRTIVIILSDGWDTAEPEILSQSLAALKRIAAKLIWLNPLLGGGEYQPLTRGMKAALPHVDVFAPLCDLASLRSLERHLRL